MDLFYIQGHCGCGWSATSNAQTDEEYTRQLAQAMEAARQHVMTSKYPECASYTAIEFGILTTWRVTSPVAA